MRHKRLFELASQLYRHIRYGAGISASVCIFLMVCTIVPDCIGRFFFDKPIYGTLELNILFMSAVVFLSLAWTQSQRGHVRVEVLISKLGPNMRSVFDIICWVIGFALFFAITIGGTKEAIHSITIGENLWGVKKFPVWPGKIAAAFGSALLCIQFLIDIGVEVQRIVSRKKLGVEFNQETLNIKE